MGKKTEEVVAKDPMNVRIGEMFEAMADDESNLGELVVGNIDKETGKTELIGVALFALGSPTTEAVRAMAKVLREKMKEVGETSEEETTLTIRPRGTKPGE